MEEQKKGGCFQVSPHSRPEPFLMVGQGHFPSGRVFFFFLSPSGQKS